MKYFALLGALLVAVGCGSKDHATPYVGPSGGGSGGRASSSHAGATGKGGAGGNSGASGDAGEAGAGTEINPLAPIVTVTSPEAVSDPNSNKVIVDPNVIVLCTAATSTTAGAAAVNASSVQIGWLDATGKQIAEVAGKPTGKPDEYSATFVLSEPDLSNGVVSFSCSASDLAMTPSKSSALVSTFIDFGPTITVSGPVKDSAHSLDQPLEFDFAVAAAPIAQGDKGAAVGDVELVVDGVNIDELSANEVSPGKYHLSVDLHGSRFKPTPTGSTSVSIVAKDARKPQATNTFDYHVLIDGTGPVIAITAPKGTFVGGKVALQFTVTDDGAGVDPSKVGVALNGDPADFYPGNNWSPIMGNAFTYTFDTKLLLAQTEVTVNITAADLVGNPSAQGASQFYHIDNVRPDLDLQPGNFIERKAVNATEQCSNSFNPLGDSPVDLQPVPSTNRFRALLWDEGNHSDGQKYDYFSGIDDNTVSLYVQSNPSAGLLRNVEGIAGGECDGVVAASTTVKFVTFAPIAPAGTALYSASAQAVAGCMPGTDTPDNRVTLCNGGSDLYRVIQHELAAKSPAVPAIYSYFPPPPADTAQCTGTEFNLADLVSADGWLCVAVVAKDLTGNPAASAPLRLCLDSDKYPGAPTCKTAPGTPPSCIADTCVPQPHFRAAENPVLVDLP